jgi:hypothetical protein
MANRFNPPCTCCGCVLDAGYLPWAYANDTERIAGGWTSTGSLWRGGKPLRANGWQLLPAPQLLDGDGWQIPAATIGTPLSGGIEVRGTETDRVLISISSEWVAAEGPRPACAALKIVVDETTQTLFYFRRYNGSADTFIQPNSGSSPTIQTNPYYRDTDYATYLPSPNIIVSRITKRLGSVSIEFTAPFNGTTNQTYPIELPGCVILPSDTDDHYQPSLIDVAGTYCPSLIEGVSAVEFPLTQEWDETFHLAFSASVKFENDTRNALLAQNTPAVYLVTKVGIDDGDHEYEAGVSGNEKYVIPTQKLPFVKCANPGYQVAMPPIYSLPAWKVSLSGWTDAGLHHTYTGPVTSSSRSVTTNNTLLAIQTNTFFYQITAINRKSAIQDWSVLSVLDQTRFHIDSKNGGSCRVLNEFLLSIPTASSSVPDITRSYFGPVGIRVVQVDWQIERSMDGLTPDDNYVDIVARVEITGDGQTLGTDSLYRAADTVPSFGPQIGANYVAQGVAGYLRRSDPVFVSIRFGRQTYYERRTQVVNYRKRVPRWSGDLPDITIDASDLVSSVTYRVSEPLTPIAEDVYWLYGWEWNWRNATYTRTAGNGGNITADVFQASYGINVVPDLEIALSASVVRAQAGFEVIA